TEVQIRQEIERLLQSALGAVKELEADGMAHFHPVLEKAAAIIPAIKALAPEAPSRVIHLFEDYVARGVERVQSGVFAKLEEVVGKAENIGDQIKTAVARPATIIAGVARDVGAIVAEGEDTLRRLAREAEDLTKSIAETTKQFGHDIGDAIPDAKV